MPVSTVTTSFSYKPGSAMLPETIPFQFMDPVNIVVTHVSHATGVRTVLSSDIGYSILGNGPSKTGRITAKQAWPGDDLFFIERRTEAVQKADVKPHEPVPAQALTAQLDRSTMGVQEAQADVSETQARALMVPPGEVVPDLPRLADRIGGVKKVLAVDQISGAIGVEPIDEAYVGPPGGDANSYSTLTAMQAAGLTGLTYNLAAPSGADGGYVNGPFTYRTGNFTGRTDVVALGGVPLNIGALVRQGAQSVAYTAPEATVTGDVQASIALRPTTPQELRGIQALDGVPNEDSVSAHTAFLALEGTDRDMIVPPGDYLYDNSEPRQINYYTGELKFAPGARLIFTHLDRMGLFFFGGSPTVRGVRLTTLVEPTERVNDAAMLRFDFTTNAIASDIVVERGAGAGILVRGGTGFGGDNITVENTLADGFDFFNHSQGRLSGLTAFNVGDDGLGCVSYVYAGSDPTDLAPQGNGLTLSDIQVRSTRTRGISFIGYANCTLNGFIVEDTQGDGVIIERDDPAQTHTPTGITISNGLITNAGQRIIDLDYSGNKYGIKVGQSGSVSVSDVNVVNSRSCGVNATSSELNAHLYINGVRVETAGDEGFYFYNHRSVTYGVITAQDTRLEGIRTLSVDRLVGIKRVAIRASKAGGSFRAVWDESNAFQDPGTTIIEDLNGPATGFIYRVAGTGRGSVGQVQWNQSGSFYNELVAPYMTIPSREFVKRDDVSPGSGDIFLSPYDAWQRSIYAPVTANITVGLPTVGMTHGDEVSIARYNSTGTFSVDFRDRNNGDALVTSIPPGTAMINRVRWDAVNSRWLAAGKSNL